MSEGIVNCVTEYNITTAMDISRMKDMSGMLSWHFVAASCILDR